MTDQDHIDALSKPVKDAPTWDATPCPHCQCRFDYHEVGCVALIDEIVERTTSGFRSDVERIMAEYPKTKSGYLTSEQQCALVADASGWRERALKAETELAALIPKPSPKRDPIEELAAQIHVAWSNTMQDGDYAAFTMHYLRERGLLTLPEGGA